MLLTDGVSKVFWPPFARQNEIAQQGLRGASEDSGPRQPLPGTRRHRYRCSLPGLAEFAANRRGEADADRGDYPQRCRSFSITNEGVPIIS